MISEMIDYSLKSEGIMSRNFFKITLFFIGLVLVFNTLYSYFLGMRDLIIYIPLFFGMISMAYAVLEEQIIHLKEMAAYKIIIDIFQFIYIIFIFTTLIILGFSSFNTIKNSQFDYKEKIVVVTSNDLLGDLPKKALDKRLEVALKYSEINKDAIFILSGARPIDGSNLDATYMKEYLESFGINRNKIILDEKATSLEESLIYSKDIIKNKLHESTNIVIITDAYQNLRIKLISGELGYDKVTNIGTINLNHLTMSAYFQETFNVYIELFNYGF